MLTFIHERINRFSFFPPAGTSCRTGQFRKGWPVCCLGLAMRVACYIDGFNLYHSLDDLQKPYLKWVDLWALSQSLCRPGETLAKVAYFSAFATWRADAYARHRQYVSAIQQHKVECHMARFSAQTARCLKCKTTWIRHEEKETDVHFSLTFLEDAIDNV